MDTNALAVMFVFIGFSLLLPHNAAGVALDFYLRAFLDGGRYLPESGEIIQ